MTRTTHTAGTVDSYFVCATPRTGSSLLLGLLESTGVAGHPQAYFRAPDEALWAERWRLPRTTGGFAYADFVRAARTAGSGPNGVFGAKLMWGTLDELVAKLGDVHPELRNRETLLLERVFGRTRFVHLRREDVLAQAVSWLRAEQTGAWYVGGNGEITGGASPGGGPPCYDRLGIEALVRTIEDHDAAWERWFTSADVHPYRITYEQMDSDLSGVTQSVLRFLGLALPPGRTITPRHRRQADELTARWIARYRAETAPASDA